MEMEFSRVNQIGIVVRDLEKTAKYLQDKFEIGPFATLEHKLPKGRIKIGLAFLENLQVELIEVLEGETVYSKFFQERGEGIHHLGFFVKDIEEAKKWAEKKGIKVLDEGNVAGVRYAYLDTEDDAGFILEFIQV